MPPPANGTTRDLAGKGCVPVLRPSAFGGAGTRTGGVGDDHGLDRGTAATAGRVSLGKRVGTGIGAAAAAALKGQRGRIPAQAAAAAAAAATPVLVASGGGRRQAAAAAAAGERRGALVRSGHMLGTRVKHRRVVFHRAPVSWARRVGTRPGGWGDSVWGIGIERPLFCRGTLFSCCQWQT